MVTEPLPDIKTFRLSPEVVAPLRERLSHVATQTIDAIMAEVPAYAEAFAGDLGTKIERAVRAALGTFLGLVSRPQGSDPQASLAPALEAAYSLGRGEARSGRSLDALLGAYRVGARAAWHELAAISVRTEQPAATIAHFAELVFAYIDELSAASVAGHADQLATSGRARTRDLEQLTQALLAGEAESTVVAAAQRADWSPPRTLTAVLVPEHAARTVLDLLDHRTLRLSGSGPAVQDFSVLLVPDADGSVRAAVLGLLRGQIAVVGPARPWLGVKASYERAVRALRIAASPVRTVVDTEEHLAELVLTADPQALADLRAKVLEPLSAAPDMSAAKLAETLRSWLRHQGRRDEVAAELFIHPQTVRYRMNQLRDLYGDRLRDPDWVSALVIALTLPEPAGLRR